MPEIWIKEAEDLKPSGTSGAMSGTGPARAVCHVTVSPSGGSWFDAMHRVLVNKKAEPHLLYDPVTDRLGQYFPLDRSARALMSGGKEISHNKVGKACIQVEFVANPDGFTRYWKPGPNYRAMMRAIASWGIEPQFVARPAKSYGDDVRQSWTKYKTTGGWWGHCHIPSPETHWDPGPIDYGAFFAAAPTALSEEDEMAAYADQLNRIESTVAAARQEANYSHIHAKQANTKADQLTTRVVALEATVGVLANSIGLNPDLVTKTISDAVAVALSKITLTRVETP